MKILIIGAFGFIGANCVKHFSDHGHTVIAFDDLSKKGSADNLEWLEIGGSFVSVIGDIRIFSNISKVFAKYGPFDLILHLAGQTAVTTSVSNPRDDFERNTCGSFNLLEAVRLYNPSAAVIYSSTNKVYGEMADSPIEINNGRYEYALLGMKTGITEAQPLNPHSPYGCSKACADQYFLDYARMYCLKTVVFRQSCIYGPRQLASSDQGWIAWFCIAAATGRPITIYGDGKQTRDILFISDLIRAYESAYKNIDSVQGSAFNIGGGPENTISVNELLDQITHRENVVFPQIVKHAPWRPGDQKVYVSNISRAEKLLNWKPKISAVDGISQLFSWVTDNIKLFQ